MKTLPLSILSLCAFIIIGSFLLPVPTDNQQASIASAQSTPSFIITNQTVQTREGSSAAIKIKATTPVQATTKVCTTVSPDQGTTSRDYVKSSNTCVTFYKGGLSEKTLTVRTVRTQAEANKSLTVNISSTKVGTASTQRITPSATQTAKVLIADQKTAPGTILTGNNQNNNTNNNNNQNNNNTNLPPTNCAQYEGVIPGESRKVIMASAPTFHKKFNYTMSAEGQAQHKTLYKAFGYSYRWFDDSPRPRLHLGSGKGYTVAFKTLEYNTLFGIHPVALSEVPGNPDGVIAMSVSECPGDFTSPFFDGPGKYCVSMSRDASINITVNNPGGATCDLQPNKTYYYNITSGFTDTNKTKGGTTYPHIGAFCGDSPSCVPHHEAVIDWMSMYEHGISGVGTLEQRHNLEIIKGKEVYYAEERRIADHVAGLMQQRVAACRNLLANSTGNFRPSCAGLAIPKGSYEWEMD